MKVELRGVAAEFVRAEAARLGRSPAEVVTLMVQCQMLARDAAQTPQGQRALAEAVTALRVMDHGRKEGRA